MTNNNRLNKLSVNMQTNSIETILVKCRVCNTVFDKTLMLCPGCGNIVEPINCEWKTKFTIDNMLNVLMCSTILFAIIGLLFTIMLGAGIYSFAIIVGFIGLGSFIGTLSAIIWIFKTLLIKKTKNIIIGIVALVLNLVVFVIVGKYVHLF